MQHTPRPFAADDRNEDDLSYFTARRNINERIRFPIAGEFPFVVIEPGLAAFVRVIILERDATTGQPTRRRRRLQFCDGGNA